MQLRIFALLICCCLARSIYSQEHMILPVTLPDSATITAYIQATDKIALKHPDSALLRYVQAADRARSINYDEALLYCLSWVGGYYLNVKNDYRRSLAIFYEALPYAEKVNDPKGYSLIPRLYNLIAMAFFYTDNYDSTIRYQLLALHAIDSLELERDKLYLSILGNLGSTLAASRQYQRGAQYIQKAIRLLSQKAKTKGLDHEDSVALALAKANMGSLYANFLNKPDSAQYWWGQAAALYKLLEKKTGLQGVYANMGCGWLIDALSEIDVEKAKAYLDSAVALDPVTAEKDVQVQTGLGRLCYHLGEYHQGIKFSLRAIELSEEAGFRQRKAVNYHTLSKCYAALGNAKEGHKYDRLSMLLMDSLYNEEKNYAISKMEVQYQVAEKDKALAEKQAALYRQRYLLTGSAGIALLLGFALIGFIRTSRHKQRLEKERLQSVERQQKIDQLQVERETEERERKRIAQELHDGLGTLISATKISQKLLIKMLPEAATLKPYLESRVLLNQMHEEVGIITNNLIPDYITQHGLESALQTLIEKFQHPDTFDIQLHTFGRPKELKPDRTFSLYRVIEEILHNAVRHSGGNLLLIQLMYHEEQLHISIEDNGTGFDPENQYGGMGLQNIRNRVQKLEGQLHLSAKPGKGTGYMLEIPY